MSHTLLFYITITLVAVLKLKIPMDNENNGITEPMINKSRLTSPCVIIEDGTGNAKYRGKTSKVMLTYSTLVIQNKEGKIRIEADLRDVIGAKVCETSTPTEFKLTVYRYVVRNGWFGVHEARSPEHIEVLFTTERSDCEKWANAINRLCATNTNDVDGSLSTEDVIVDLKPPRRRKFLIFINPMSGQGRALSIWKQHAKHMCYQGNVEVHDVLTTHANHACEYVASLDNLDSYDGVGSIGGDGIFAEVINGITQREDSEKIFKSVALVPIPGGTSNGLVKSILYECGEEMSIVNSLFVSLKGHLSPLDFSLTTTLAKDSSRAVKRYNSFLIMAWGLVADIDILSESMRCLGEPRLYVAAVYFLMMNRHYHGKLSMLLADEANGGITELDIPPLDEPIQNTYTIDKKKKNHTNKDIHKGRFSGEDINTLGEVEEGRGSGDTNKHKWLVIDDSFAMVWVCQTSHSSASVHSGPDITLDDGVFTIYVIREISRFYLFPLLLDLDSGAFTKHSKVETYKARAYRLEPLMSEKGIYSLDGESVEYGPIQGVIHPGRGRILKT